MEGCSSRYCTIVHDNHRLCEECLGEYFEKFNTLQCDECKYSALTLMQNYYLCECELSVEKFYLKTCKNHIYCDHCIKYSNIRDKCEFCEDTFSKKEICMYHFDIIDNKLSIVNPSCIKYFSHTYCKEAFAQFNEDTNSFQNQCHWCKLLYSSVEVPVNICALCKTSSIDDAQQLFCDNHRYCNECIKFFKLIYCQFFFDIQNCKKCEGYFKKLFNANKNKTAIISEEIENSCNACFKSKRNLILNPCCLKNHSYCDDCLYKNKNKNKISIKCEKCLVFCNEVKEHMCYLCKKDNFNLTEFSKCPFHIFCLKCFKILLSNFQEYKIECEKCLSYLESKNNKANKRSNQKYSVANKNIKKCTGCSMSFSNNPAYLNLSCEEYHEYCENCIKSCFFSGFGCSSCERFNLEHAIQFCDMCKVTSLDGSRVTHCRIHTYCKFCIDILNKDNYNLYSLKDPCKECENYFRNSKSIFEENIDSRVFTDLFCFSCDCRLTEKILVLNPACTYNHIYCLNCYEKLETVGFKCEKCFSILENSLEYYCSLCRADTAISKDRNCKDHYYCEICINILNSKQFPVYTKIKNCKKCNSRFFGKLKAPKAIDKNQQIRKNTTKNETGIKNINHQIKVQESIEENKICYENPPPQNSITNYPGNNQSVLSLSNNLNYNIFQDSFGVCKFCGSLGKLMECQHPFCYACFLQSFRVMFNNFLNTLRQGINPANYENQIIKCIYENCNNRFCVPFGLFKETAIADMKSYSLYVEGILDYYSLHFEGFPLSFYYCHCNGGVYSGVYQGDTVACHYCKSSPSYNFNTGTYY